MREWSGQEFFDPEGILQEVARSRVGFIPDQGRAPGWQNLRSNELNQERQWLDAAVFTLGVREALGIDARLARHEDDDFDFLVTWPSDGEQNACPVQLKELVPNHLNPDAGLNQLIASLQRYSCPTDTIVAIKLNRTGRFDFNSLEVPALPFRQLWLFGSESADNSRWFLYGNVVDAPRYHSFSIPI